MHNALILFLLQAIALAAGERIVVRHDVAPDRFTEAARSFEASVVQIRHRDATGLIVAEGTLIGDRWVLTAAHSVAGAAGPVTVRFRGVEHSVNSVVLHPTWNGVFEDLHDLALLRLARSIETASPVLIYQGEGEHGRTVHLVGRGMTGTGQTGPTVDDGLLRAATNRVREVGPLHLAFVFDAPDSPGATELEGISGPGDSGGPAFLVEESDVWLVGVSSAQDSEPTGGRDGVYGVVEYYTRVSSFRGWIDSVVTSAGGDTVALRGGGVGREALDPTAMDPCVPVVAPGHEDAVEPARRRLKDLMSVEPMPGVAIAVVAGDELLWSEGFGKADIGSARPVCRSTRFRIGSVSKVITALTLLRLSDARRIELDADVRAIVPRIGHYPEPVSLKQLAGHLGGVRHYGRNDYFNTRSYASTVDALEVFADDSIIAAPGTRFHYSSYGYNLLGAALELSQRVPYAQLVDSLVLGPLSLQQTHPESRVPAGALATPHSVNGDSLAPSPTAFDTSDRMPSGGWASTAEDIARLGAALTNPGFLSHQSRGLLNQSLTTAAGEDTGYSLGLRLGQDPSRRGFLHHGGTSIGARAFLLVYPSERLAVAVLANGPAEFAEDEVAAIARAFLR